MERGFIFSAGFFRTMPLPSRVRRWWQNWPWVRPVWRMSSAEPAGPETKASNSRRRSRLAKASKERMSSGVRIFSASSWEKISLEGLGCGGGEEGDGDFFRYGLASEVGQAISHVPEDPLQPIQLLRFP